MISIPEALAEMAPAFVPRPVERVPLTSVRGRCLAGPLTVRLDVPAFDNSAMDGYAVRAHEAVQDAALPVRGESRAGGAWPEPLAPGSAMRIFTGAPLPEGADAIVIQEDTKRDADTVTVTESATLGRHIRRQAEVLRAGSSLLPVGTRLDPGAIGVLASQGIAMVPVRTRPRVVLLSTGDELREMGSPPRRGSLIDSNTYALAAAVEDAGAEAICMPLGADDRESLTAAVRDGLSSGDVLITTGGVSVGEYDLVHTAFEAAGVEPRFWKIRVKPGKPVRFGVAGAVPVVGLPGNPVSALVTFEVFVRPQLRRMLADPSPFRATRDVSLGWAARAPATRTELIRVRFEGDTARRTSAQGSNMLTSMVGVHGLAVLPAGAGMLDEGQTVRAIDLRGPSSDVSPFA
ncbi:MAG: gephyrin-like molybdotransferase Glp [Sandaracinaceae bacterium]